MSDDLRCWRLDGGGVCLVLASAGGGLAEVVHWGAPLPENESPEALVLARRGAATGGMPDALAPLSVCPESAEGFQGAPGLVARDADGRPLRRRFRFAAEAASAGSLALDFEAAPLAYRRIAAFDGLRPAPGVTGRLPSPAAGSPEVPAARPPSDFPTGPAA